jgi:hypothetical protein
MRPIVLPFLLLGALALPAVEAAAQDDGDAPDQGVARISLLSGEVSVRRGDTGEVIDAELNAPLVTLDHVLTNTNARAEIQLDWANMIRLGPESGIRMAELADRRFRVELSEGMMTLRVLRDSNGRLEISTPTASLRPKDKGTYRILVRQDFSTEVTVRSGNMDVFVGDQFSNLRSGQALVIDGDPTNPQRSFVSAAPRDDWDIWNESRDRDLERSDSYKYVSRDIYGADDLHGHGRWVYDSPYGWVWAPYVAVDWAPYRAGRWVWASYYGWTWVSTDAWGWAPYHYGRWYQAPRYGWVWYPGPVNVRYYWRPALVGFFGWGDSVGVRVGFGFGNVGWVPLAPYEVYRPWYGRNNVTIVNVIRNVNVVNTYRNGRDVRGRNAFTAVHADDFGRRRTNVYDFVRTNDRSPSRVVDTRSRGGFDNTPRQNPRDDDRAPAGRGGNPQNRQDNAQPQRGRGDAGVAANPGNGQDRGARGRGNEGDRPQEVVRRQADSNGRPNEPAQSPGGRGADSAQRQPRDNSTESAGNRGANRPGVADGQQDPTQRTARGGIARAPVDRGVERTTARVESTNPFSNGGSPRAPENPGNPRAGRGGQADRPEQPTDRAAAGGVVRAPVDRGVERTTARIESSRPLAPGAQAPENQNRRIETNRPQQPIERSVPGSVMRAPVDRGVERTTARVERNNPAFATGGSPQVREIPGSRAPNPGVGVERRSEPANTGLRVGVGRPTGGGAEARPGRSNAPAMASPSRPSQPQAGSRAAGNGNGGGGNRAGGNGNGGGRGGGRGGR